MVIGCVDVPTKGVDLPNYHSSVRVVNSTNGLGSVQTLVSEDKTDLSTSPKIVFRKRVYVDYELNFASNAITVSIDGGSGIVLNSGSASSQYYSMLSGSRKIRLSSDSRVVDTITTRDTLFYRADGSLLIKVPGPKDTVLPAGTVNANIQFANETKSIDPNKKGTLFIHSIDATGSYVTFINERKVFERAVVADSALVRFINSVNDTLYTLELSSSPSVPLAKNVGFMLARNYTEIKGLTDTLKIKRGTQYIASLPISISNRKRYTFVAWKDALSSQIISLTDD